MDADQKNPAEVAETEAQAIPHDLRVALACWWRAYHHGNREEQEGAELVLCHALSDRIGAIRAIVFGEGRT
ncbi:MAG TPA: hypothetical protein VGC15_20370 [Acetobacteraceae bacterium]